MRIYCAGALPSGVEVRRTFDMIVHTGRVDLGGRTPDSLDDRSEAVTREFVAMGAGGSECRHRSPDRDRRGPLRHRRRRRALPHSCRESRHPRRDMRPGRLNDSRLFRTYAEARLPMRLPTQHARWTPMEPIFPVGVRHLRSVICRVGTALGTARRSARGEVLTGFPAASSREMCGTASSASWLCDAVWTESGP